MRGIVCSLANYSVACEETQSESPRFVILRFLCFQRKTFLTFIRISVGGSPENE